MKKYKVTLTRYVAAASPTDAAIAFFNLTDSIHFEFKSYLRNPSTDVLAAMPEVEVVQVPTLLAIPTLTAVDEEDEGEEMRRTR